MTRLLDNALRKAAAVWITVDDRPRLVWALWRDGALWVAVGGDEQQVPGLGDGVTCTITVRSPTTHSHLADVPATASLVEPEKEVTDALRAARLNAEPLWTEVYRLDPDSQGLREDGAQLG
ncbi:hypothetical protein [Kutzneria buriramensis]|uniref:Pyridoxamine 5'-phosphate oxidase n=1 Tax=Kutzneria buriramensis TaxID=1045776 RepID=A0A3E0HC66_9PSEU|nr:hypothetical protein [Kutzneria buriramensis]REH41984.1 hypothetical protein BCF44_111289 [Kutzneria buriramensis]